MWVGVCFDQKHTHTYTHILFIHSYMGVAVAVAVAVGIRGFALSPLNINILFQGNIFRQNVGSEDNLCFFRKRHLVN